MSVSSSSSRFRLAIDLQALQTKGSRHRGIGRYSSALLESMLDQVGGSLDLRFYANGLLPPPELDVRGYPLSTLPYDRLVAADSLAYKVEDRLVCEALLQTQLIADGVDAVFVPSPMEMNDAVMPNFAGLPIRVYSVCYDLIPLLSASTDLGNKDIQEMYHRRLQNIKYADGVFAISDATNRDTVRLLETPAERVHTIYAGVSSFFAPLPAEEKTKWRQHLQEKFGVGEHFLLYNGGENWRKNMDGMIRAFAKLPRNLRDKYQLVLACKMSADFKEMLAQTALRAGVADRTILTGFVSDDELKALYNLTTLFVFPSLYEGFGLPIVEAMACGTGVIAADNSSLPEVVGDPSCLFDGASATATAKKITETLESPARLQELRAHALVQAGKFTWARAAELCLAPMLVDLEQSRIARKVSVNVALHRTPERTTDERTAVALFSPLPPAPSGISDYTAELVPYLSEHVDVYPVLGKAHPVLAAEALPQGKRVQPAVNFLEWEKALLTDSADSLRCDMPVYQMGNSKWHADMYAALLRYPGITVLHDYNLNGLLGYIVGERPDLGITLEREVAHSYAERSAYNDVLDTLLTKDSRLIERLPERYRFTNRRIFTRSLGVIVHSEWAYKQALKDWGTDCPYMAHIPQLMPLRSEKAPTFKPAPELRRRLSLPADKFLVASVGYIHNSKRSVPLLEAFRRFVTTNSAAHLVFVGASELFDGDFAAEIAKRGLEKHVTVTGFVSMESLYDYVNAADICVNLRFPSGGETSASLLRILSQGKACIISDIGSFTDYPASVCHKIPPVPALKADESDVIAEALTQLHANPSLRESLAVAAYEYVRTVHAPERCARLYAEFIDAVRRDPQTARKLLADYAGREAAKAMVNSRRWSETADRRGLLVAFTQATEQRK